MATNGKFHGTSGRPSSAAQLLEAAARGRRLSLVAGVALLGSLGMLASSVRPPAPAPTPALTKTKPVATVESSDTVGLPLPIPIEEEHRLATPGSDALRR